MDYIEEPLNYEDIRTTMDSNCYVTANISIHLFDILYNDVNEFLECLSNTLTGTPLLEDIKYKIIGVKENNILIVEVTGDVSSVLSVMESESYNKDNDEEYHYDNERYDSCNCPECLYGSYARCHYSNTKYTLMYS